MDSSRMDDMKNRLLSDHDHLAEKFVLGFVDALEKTNDCISADDSHQKTLNTAIHKLTEISPILAHRFTPILKEYLSHIQQQELDQVFATVNAMPTCIDEMSTRYRYCFDAFIDAQDCISIRTTDTRLLGKLDAKDVFILTLWAMATCKRQKGDNLLQLICSGKSSCGK